MAKIMLVEDDNNLREIYEARLLAEGYEIVSAKDGEEALAMAVKEKPDLIISDVMMPKISGFDMLDILRTTPETKNTKIIMMTALSQAEDKARADKLGADRYLVKSQVTLEDVANVAKEVLSGESTPTTGNESATTPATAAATPTSSIITPQEPAAGNTTAHEEPVDPPAQTPEPVVDAPSQTMPAPTEPTQTTPPAPAIEEPSATQPPGNSPVTSTTAITEPIVASTTSATSEEPPKDPSLAENPGSIDKDLSQTIEDEESAIDAQIDNFIATAVSSEPEQPEPTPEPPKEAPTVVAETPTDPVEHIEVAQAPPDATTAAADNAAKLADAVNDMLQNPITPAPTPEKDETKAEEPTAAPESSTNSKRVIQPINDLSAGGPDLNALLAKEEQKEIISNSNSQTPEPTPTAPETPIEPAANIIISPEGEITSGSVTTAAPEPVTAQTPPTTPKPQAPSVPEQAAVTETPSPTDPNDPNNIAL